MESFGKNRWQHYLCLSDDGMFRQILPEIFTQMLLLLSVEGTHRLSAEYLLGYFLTFSLFKVGNGGVHIVLIIGSLCQC